MIARISAQNARVAISGHHGDGDRGHGRLYTHSDYLTCLEIRDRVAREHPR
jgi:hypothetical protein